LSRYFDLRAYSENTLAVYGFDVGKVEYTVEWFDKFMEHVMNGEYPVEGKLYLGLSYAAHMQVINAIRELNMERQIIVGDDESLFGKPEDLCKVLLHNWKKWHEEDPKYDWGEQTIINFFEFYKWAIILVYVY
jgi:hypothetical protein